MTEFITVEALVTFGGATAAAGAVTELLKPLLKKLPFEISPRIISFFAALAILTVGFAFSGSREPADYVLCVINAVFVSLSSNGGYDVIKAIVGGDGGTEDNDEDNT